mmetsp:Transcript_18098/g.29290  ORF Transcript_18098/g.29290 Transcript_18098/m.29290 type:complete len:82 (+) Transcript_18098:644-889(+)
MQPLLAMRQQWFRCYWLPVLTRRPGAAPIRARPCTSQHKEAKMQWCSCYLLLGAMRMPVIAVVWMLWQWPPHMVTNTLPQC